MSSRIWRADGELSGSCSLKAHVIHVGLEVAVAEQQRQVGHDPGIAACRASKARRGDPVLSGLNGGAGAPGPAPHCRPDRGRRQRPRRLPAATAPGAGADRHPAQGQHGLPRQ